jgi:LAO/AO transport system kinase
MADKTQQESGSEAETEAFVARLRKGDARILARAVSLVENGSAEAGRILSACFPLTGGALTIGVTGAPGAGKSTLVDGLARVFREQGHAVGILAVDPTSPYSGGAILGDRIRMERHHSDPGVFVRSMATRGALGGLARATADAATVIEASGRDRILIETVGVGQDEVDIVRLADVVVVVLVPGMGDDVQSIKAGILEIADIFVVNKSDREGADRVEKELKAMQSLAGRHGVWVPPVVRTVGLTGAGIDQLAKTIDSFRDWLTREDRLNARREAHWRTRLLERVRQEMLRQAREHGLSEDELAKTTRRIVARQEDPFLLAERLAGALVQGGAGNGIADGLGAAASAQIDHLGIAVRSIAAARGFYEALGLRVSHEEDVEHEGVRTAMMPVGESRIELLEPLREDSPVGKFLARRGEGLHHVAFRVGDIAAVREDLLRRGVTLITNEVQRGAGGHLYVFVHPRSAAGVLIEIVQESH